MLGLIWDRINGWGTNKLVGLFDMLGVQINPATEDKQDDIIEAIGNFVGMEIPPHDYISIGYTGSNITTVLYYSGGSGGLLVATLTLEYSGDNLISITKT